MMLRSALAVISALVAGLPAYAAITGEDVVRSLKDQKIQQVRILEQGHSSITALGVYRGRALTIVYDRQTGEVRSLETGRLPETRLRSAPDVADTGKRKPFADSDRDASRLAGNGHSRHPQPDDDRELVGSGDIADTWDDVSGLDDSDVSDDLDGDYDPGWADDDTDRDDADEDADGWQGADDDDGWDDADDDAGQDGDNEAGGDDAE